MDENHDARMGEKIKRLRSFRGLTCAELAAAIGCTRPYLSAVENGRYPASTKIIRKLQRALDVAPDYFQNAEEPGLDDTTSFYAKELKDRQAAMMNGESASVATISPSRGVSRMIPFVALSTNGRPSVEFDEFPSGDTDRIECPGDVDDVNAFAMRIDGDEMASQIPPGAMIFVAPGLPVRENRPVLVRMNDGEIVCRRYQAKSDQVILAPFNANYTVRLVDATQVDWIYPVVKVSIDVYNSRI